jgi:hypothetical protein
MTSDVPEGFFVKRSDPVPRVVDGPVGGHGGSATAGDVGDFRQGTPASRWALARYLVGRAIGESVGIVLMLAALVLAALAVLAGWAVHLTFVAVLVGLAAVFVLVLRAGLMAILHRLTASDRYGPVEQRLRGLVADTRGDVRRELRRIGLPSHLLTMPLLGFRLVGRRRPDTFARLRSFDVDRAVPAARLDELHLLLRGTFGTTGRSGSAAR